MRHVRKREYALAAAAMALALFSWHGGDRPEDRVLDMLPINAATQWSVGTHRTDPAGPVAVDAHSAAVAAPYLHGGLDCLRSRDGLKLRLAIQHCPDGSPFERWCYHQCFYGSVDRRAAM